MNTKDNFVKISEELRRLNTIKNKTESDESLILLLKYKMKLMKETKSKDKQIGILKKIFKI
jgi:hypothetical protein